MGRFFPDRIAFGPVAAARPWLLMKLFLLLLAFDCWIDLSPHGGRYGIGDFNVAHFAWLDVVTPTPTPAFYVGLISFCGLLALATAIGGVNRWALGILAAAYTYSWAMSMLDSYQHHYLLTLMLVPFVFYPAVDTGIVLGARTASDTEPDEVAASKAPEKSKKSKRSKRSKRAKSPKAAKRAAQESSASPLPGGSLSAWAYHATAVSIGIVYTYTALSKSEPQWRDGTALQSIATEGMAPFYAYFVDDRGWAHDTFWSTVGLSVILLQVVIAAGYYCAPLLDRRDLRWPRWVCGAAWFGAINFHLGAEYLELQIGWFSYYMLIAACVFLLPASAVDFVARGAARVADGIVKILEAEDEKKALLPAIGVAGICGLAGYAVDMPGTLAASIALGVLLVVFVIAKRTAVPPLPWVLGAALAALCMWLAFVGTEARYDYYRFVGGDHRRRGELEEALEAYVKANDYAPEEDDRREREDEVRRQLGLAPRWSSQ